MSYPTYRQDFEGGTTLATACPELVDSDSMFTIDSSGSHAFTGTHSLSLTPGGSNHNIVSNANDTLSGNVTLTAYVNFGQTLEVTDVQARQSPLSIAPTSFQRLTFSASNGIAIIQSNAGTVTTLNTPISGVTPPVGVWLCCELRCNGTAISARVIRQDTGQFFVNTGTGSWSSSPQTQTGTASMTPAAGGFGMRVGDGVGYFIDDIIYGPAVPSIDLTSFTINGVGTGQQLTAGGFTDPLFGVTWSSTNTSVATVNSTGLVTSVSAGTSTITATGKRDTTQTATSTVTVNTTVTTYAVTPPSPPSGFVHRLSGNFAVAPNGTYSGTITGTPSGGGLSGADAITHTWSSSSAPQNFNWTPTAVGTVTITWTNSGGLTDPSVNTYTSLAQTLSVSPTNFVTNTTATVTATGGGTTWNSGAPTFSFLGVAGTFEGAVTVISDTQATFSFTTGSATGAGTFTDSTTSATASVAISAPPTTWGFPSIVYNFASGLVGTVGYTVSLISDGTVITPRTTAGVIAVGRIGYGAIVQIPFSGGVSIEWDDGAGHIVAEAIQPRGVEPPSSVLNSGMNDIQALGEILAIMSGLASGFVSSGTSSPVYKAPDQATVRASGTVDELGNRTGIALFPIA
jgi:hypothetical protein